MADRYMNNMDLIDKEVVEVIQPTYYYGSTVKCVLLPMMPFVNKSAPIDQIRRAVTSRIMNKTPLQVSSYTTSNYILVPIPVSLAPDETLRGYKGDRFLTEFYLKDMNRYQVLSRYSG
jgi:hypothetical protein